MFCDGCGSEVYPGQDFCSKCGKRVLGTISLVQPSQGRVQEHVRLLGLLWLGFSAFNTIGGIILFVLAKTLFAHLHGGDPDAPTAFLRPLLTVVALILLAKAALGFVTGWGLLQHEHWARVVVIVLAFISLFTNIPVGTALGIYTLWVLLPARSEREYAMLSQSQAA